MDGNKETGSSRQIKEVAYMNSEQFSQCKWNFVVVVVGTTVSSVPPATSQI